MREKRDLGISYWVTKLQVQINSNFVRLASTDSSARVVSIMNCVNSPQPSQTVTHKNRDTSIMQSQTKYFVTLVTSSIET